MKDKVFGVLQRVGRSFMLPIAILPVAGLFLGIGGSFTNETMLRAYGLYDAIGPGTVVNAVLQIMNAAGNIVFANLPLLFAIGCAIGMAKKEKEVAALSAVIAFFIMHVCIATLISINYPATGGQTSAHLFEQAHGFSENSATTDVLGVTSLSMGVFGGVIAGLGVAALHNKYYKIQLPTVISFFGGTRFVPIISAIVYLFVGILLYFVWPPIQTGIAMIGDLVRNSGYAGTLIYGITERALIPFGLHHVFYMPFWQTSLGGEMIINGQLVQGAQNIFFAQLSDPTVQRFSVSATRFMSGKFPMMIFGLPGAALAMYHCAKPEKKKVAGGLLLSAAFTSMLTGITEPLEFTFLFVAPILYVIHCLFAGLAYMIMHILGVGVGMTFSGGLIDLTLFGILQGNAKTNWVWIVVVGAVYFLVYYLLFSLMIRKMDLKTPGREDDDEETKLYTRSDVNAAKAANSSVSGGDATSALILDGLGGKDNISDVDCCATRLRVTVKDGSKVDDGILKKSGASGVVRKGNGVQVIYGPRVTVIKSNLEDYMAGVHHATETEIDVPDKPKPVEVKIYSPANGRAVPLSEVNDEAFAGEILGKGMAIIPSDGRICSPVNGRVESVTDTLHAVNIVSDDGAMIIVHIGLDTVKLGGKHFEAAVKEGQKIRVGDLLVKADIEAIAEAGYDTVTPVVVCNSDELGGIEYLAKGEVKIGQELYRFLP
ncbi:MAG: glucose PTS transporter subunit IIA [Clostridia bacterium]